VLISVFCSFWQKCSQQFFVSSDKSVRTFLRQVVQGSLEKNYTRKMEKMQEGQVFYTIFSIRWYHCGNGENAEIYFLLCSPSLSGANAAIQWNRQRGRADNAHLVTAPYNSDPFPVWKISVSPSEKKNMTQEFLSCDRGFEFFTTEMR